MACNKNMDANMTVLRVKRKRGNDPADALLLACKRVRPDSVPQNAGGENGESELEEVHNSVFKLVATVATQDAPVQVQVGKALIRPQVANARRPTSASRQRIVEDLRSTKWSTRRDDRFRILSSHRTRLLDPASEQLPQTELSVRVEGNAETEEESWRQREVQVFDLIQEDSEHQKIAVGNDLPSDPEVILCNSTKMLRERLALTEEGLGTEHREHEEDYVYDLYYQEIVTPVWIEDILSVKVYDDEGELVPDLVVHEEQVYDDEDDENEEGNWRNDYPDEESDENSDREERYGGYWEEEHSYHRRTWEPDPEDLLQGDECKEDGDQSSSD